MNFSDDADVTLEKLIDMVGNLETELGLREPTDGAVTINFDSLVGNGADLDCPCPIPHIKGGREQS